MPSPLTTVNIYSERQINNFKTLQPVVLLPMLSAGTATVGQLYTINDEPQNDPSVLFGDGSMLQFVLSQMKYMDKTYGTGSTKIYAIPITDGLTASTSTLTIAGTPAQAGSFNVRVMSYEKAKYSITYTTSSTPTTIANSIVSAINANSKSLVSATSNAGVITLTTKNKSAQFNNEPLIVEGDLNGLSITIGNFTGGVDSPLNSIYLDALDNEAVDVITTFSNFDDCADKLATKFNVDGKVVDGIPFVIETNTLTSFISKNISSKKGTYISLLSYTDNNGNKMSRASQTFSMQCLVSFYMLRVLKMQMTPSINTGKFLPINEWGAKSGVHMAKRPFSKMSILECQANNSRFNLSKDEQDNLIARGFAYFGVDDFNQNVEPYNVIMSSRQNDAIFSHLNDYDVITQVRSYIFNKASEFVAEKYLGPNGQNNIGVLTADKLKTELGVWISELASDKYNLLANAKETKDTFEEQLVVEIDLPQGTIDVSFNLYHNNQISRQTFNLTITKNPN